MSHFGSNSNLDLYRHPSVSRLLYGHLLRHQQDGAEIEEKFRFVRWWQQRCIIVEKKTPPINLDKGEPPTAEERSYARAVLV